MFSFIKMMNKTQDRERECKESQKMVSLCLQEIQSLKEKVEHNASDIDDLSETVSKIYDDKNSICQKLNDHIVSGAHYLHDPDFYTSDDQTVLIRRESFFHIYKMRLLQFFDSHGLLIAYTICLVSFTAILTYMIVSGNFPWS